MYQNEDMMTVLRLLCIVSHTQASAHMNICTSHALEDIWVVVQLQTGLQPMTLCSFTHL